MEILLGQLASRIKRKAVTGGSGIRSIALGQMGSTSDADGNIISRFFDAASRFGGFLIKKAFDLVSGAVRWGFSTIWGFMVSASMFIWNFNWNITDSALDQSIQQTWAALAGTLGGTLGNAVGWLSCGVLPGAIIFAFNEPLGVYLLDQIGEEALDELAGNVAQLTQQTFQALGKTAFAYLYKNVRKSLTGTQRAKDEKALQALVRSGGITEEKAAKIRAEKAEPWSFAIATENAIESIPNETIRNFVEEFLEEAAEACIEAGYVVAAGLDSFIAGQKLSAAANPLGSQRTVEVFFNRQDDPEASAPTGGN